MTANRLQMIDRKPTLSHNLRMSKRHAGSQIIQVLQLLSKQQGKTMLARLGRGKPFDTLVATVLSARTRDEVTEKVALDLLRLFPTPKAMAAAGPHQVEKHIRRIGLYRVKSRRLVEIAVALLRDHHGLVPADMEALTQLPGVGRKTAGCVLVYAFGKTALPVDTHVHRISNRLGWVRTTTPEKTEMALQRVIPKSWWSRVNDLLVAHGKSTCKPQRPLCPQCPVLEYCPWPGRTHQSFVQGRVKVPRTV